jgi:hypothetical protein
MEKEERAVRQSSVESSKHDFVLFCAQDDFYSRATKGALQIFDRQLCFVAMYFVAQQPTMLLVELEEKKMHTIYVHFLLLPLPLKDCYNGVGPYILVKSLE